MYMYLVTLQQRLSFEMSVRNKGKMATLLRILNRLSEKLDHARA